MHRRILIIIICLCTIITSGCWDRVEIERNSFILGIGIDLAEDNKYVFTFQIALLDAFKGENEKTKSTQQISITADNLTDATNNLLRYSGNVPNYTHCKLIVFGEDYAEKGIKHSLDYIFREPEIRRTTTVCLAEGKAKDILEAEPVSAPSSALVINEIITQNSTTNSQIFPFQDVAYLHQNFIRSSDSSLVRVFAKDDQVKVSGIGILKDYKLVGYLTDTEVTGLRIIEGEIKKGLFSTQLPWEDGGRIILNAYSIDASTTPKIEDDNLKIKTRVRIEGDINDIKNPTPLKDPMELIKIWQKSLEDDTSSMIHSVFQKCQNEYGADVFEIDQKVESYYPDFWKENSEQWHDIFKTVELDLDIDIVIRRVGIIKP